MSLLQASYWEIKGCQFFLIYFHRSFSAVAELVYQVYKARFQNFLYLVVQDAGSDEIARG